MITWRQISAGIVYISSMMEDKNRMIKTNYVIKLLKILQKQQLLKECDKTTKKHDEKKLTEARKQKRVRNGTDYDGILMRFYLSIILDLQNFFH